MAKVSTDLMFTEIGHLYMETVTLKQALGDQQRETIRVGREADALRVQNEELSEAAQEQEENLIALNRRLLGKTDQPLVVANAPR